MNWTALADLLEALFPLALLVMAFATWRARNVDR